MHCGGDEFAAPTRSYTREHPSLEEGPMTRVVADISVSLDGFVTGPDPDLEHGLGHGGEGLHRWAIESTDPVDAEVLRRSTDESGAVVMGRRLFDIVGVTAAIEQARQAAGERAVVVMGGADVIRQALDHGLVDVLHLHLAPVVLGAGTPLFHDAAPRALVQQAVEVSPFATHLAYAVPR